MREVNIASISVLILGISILILIGILIELYFYNSKLLELVKKHDVIEALINKNNRGLVLFFFSVTMIMEELIFRYYSIGILNSLLGLNYLSTILISSLAFSLYHIHIWFFFKNLRLLLINLIYPFLMGLYLGYAFLTYGYWSSFLAHFIIALIMHYNLYRLNSDKKFKN
ncbi:MAG: type II CAAX prenyl endopeptidase Rce1 family protein [Promethearchaeota archaeon]